MTASRTASRYSALLIASTLPWFLITITGCSTCAADRDEDEDEEAAGQPATTGAAPASPAAAPGGQATVSWGFDADSAGQAPRGFSFGRTGSGRPGRWVVRAEPNAPSGPNVLAQEEVDPTDYRFPVAVADTPVFGDLSLSVRCKPVSGRVDQACGIVWRYQDQDDYYLARANALENNVRLYYVQRGRRVQFGGWNGKVTSGAWHELRADMRGDRVAVYYDGQRVIDAHDARFAAPGKVGVWTKADSHTLFDNLTATTAVP